MGSFLSSARIKAQIFQQNKIAVFILLIACWTFHPRSLRPKTLLRNQAEILAATGASDISSTRLPLGCPMRGEIIFAPFSKHGLWL
jgi:hypothetical protein